MEESWHGIYNRLANKQLEKKSATTQQPGLQAAGKIQENIKKIIDMEKDAEGSRTPVQHLADKITFFAGSTPFIVIHIVWFTGWVILNGNVLPGIKPFDPFPFSFLTLVVSLEAIFLTLLVLMSQNRMTREADKRAHLDLQVNMLNEQEATIILRTVQKIATHLGIAEEPDETIKELSEDTDVNQVARTLDEKSST